MGEVLRLERHDRELFADARGRGLRVSWHRDAALLIISLWDRERCVGTFHLRPTDAARLTALLASVAAAEAAPEAHAQA